MAEMYYGGRRYRSHLEVKWILVLEELGIPFTYEPGAFPIDMGLYVPDVWLPVSEHYLEIKPIEPDEKEIAKATQLKSRYGKKVFFLCEFPRCVGLELAGFFVYWHDGTELGISVKKTICLMYVFGMEESEENMLKVAIAVRRATKRMERFTRDLVPVDHTLRQVMSKLPNLPIDFPDIVNNPTIKIQRPLDVSC